MIEHAASQNLSPPHPTGRETAWCRKYIGKSLMEGLAMSGVNNNKLIVPLNCHSFYCCENPVSPTGRGVL